MVVRLTRSNALRPAFSSVIIRLSSCSLPARSSSVLMNGYFCSKRLQQRVAVVDVQRRVPHHLPFFFRALDEASLSWGLRKGKVPQEKSSTKSKKIDSNQGDGQFFSSILTF